MWSNDSPEDLGSHGYVLEAEIFEVKASFALGLADFLPTYQRDFPVIEIATFPEEFSYECFHVLDDANGSKDYRELKDGETTENRFDEDTFADKV